MEAFAASESHPTVLNAANEVAVELFLQDRIAFLDIPRLIEAELAAHGAGEVNTMDAILALDAQVRERATAVWS